MKNAPEKTTTTLKGKDIKLLKDTINTIVQIQNELNIEMDLKHALTWDYLRHVKTYFVTLMEDFKMETPFILLRSLHTGFSILYGTKIYLLRMNRLDLIAYSSAFEILSVQWMDLYDSKILEITDDVVR